MSTFLSSKNGTKARKPHRCVLCGERINVGDAQDQRTGISDGSVWTMHMHPECHAYEQRPGVVDPDWYEDVCDPAFSRAEAVEARAERAEAELAGIRALADRRNKRDHSQDTTHQLVTALDQALDIAQAELATERARVDQLILTHPLYDSRDQLDATIKEGA